MPNPYEPPKKAKRKLVTLVLGALILASEAVLFSWLNLSCDEPAVQIPQIPAGGAGPGVLYTSYYYGWPTIYLGVKYEQTLLPTRERIFQSYFNAPALSLDVGIAACIMALSAMMVIMIGRRRYNLRSMLLVTLFVAALCALFVAAPGVSQAPPPGW